MFYKFNLYSDLFCFYIMFAMINDGILSIDSSSFSKKSNHKNNQNRNLLPINKNYCTASKNQKKGEPSNLISSIIHQMQENADGQLSCISIFANYDSFSEAFLKQFYGIKNITMAERNLTDDYDEVYPTKFRYPSRWIHSDEEMMDNLNTNLPVISFSLNSNDVEITHDKIKVGSRFCPNYIFMSANLTRIKSFINTHQKYTLSRKNARYALLIKDNHDSFEAFDSSSFLDDFKLFQKVLNLAVFAFSNTETENSTSEQKRFPANLQLLNRNNRASIYVRDPKESGNMSLIGNWDEEKKILGCKTMSLFPKTRLTNLYGKTLKSSSFEYKPYTYIVKDEVDDNGDPVYDGVEVKTMNAISQALNFEYTIAPPSDGGLWGEEVSPGNFSGVVGELQKEYADIIWANLFVVPDRFRYIDYLDPYATDYVCYMVKVPPPLPQWMALVIPFQLEVWLCFAISVIVVIVFASLYTITDPTTIFRTKDAWLYVCYMVFDESYPKFLEIRKTGIRVCLTFLLLMFYTLTIGYRGTLTSLLTVKINPKPIDTIRELAFENGDIPVGSFSDNFYKATKSSTNPNFMKLAETYQTHYDFGKAFENATKGILVMAEAAPFLEYNIRSGFTDKFGVRSMHIMKECFVPFSVAFALQKDSIYTNKFNIKMNQLIEGGFINKWLNDEFDKVAKKADIGASTEAEPLTIDNIQGPFLLSSFILGLALLALIGENIWWSLTKNQKSSVEDYEAEISDKKKKVAFNGYSHENNFKLLRQ